MERTAFADALAVGGHVTADYLRFVHPDSGNLFCIFYRSEYGHVGVALATTRTADFAKPCQ